MRLRRRLDIHNIQDRYAPYAVCALGADSAFRDRGVLLSAIGKVYDASTVVPSPGSMVHPLNPKPLGFRVESLTQNPQNLPPRPETPRI